MGNHAVHLHDEQDDHDANNDHQMVINDINNRGDWYSTQQPIAAETSFIDPSDSWCDWNAIAPCPTFHQSTTATATAAHDIIHKHDNVETRISGPHPCVIESSVGDKTKHHPASSSSSAAVHNNQTSNFSGASSWLSGHVGLIQQPTAATTVTLSSQQQQQQAASNSINNNDPSNSLPKPSSFHKTLSFTKNWNRQSSSKSNTTTTIPTHQFLCDDIDAGSNIMPSCLCHNNNNSNSSSDGGLDKYQTSMININNNNNTTTTAAAACGTAVMEPTFIFTCGRNRSGEEASTLHDSWDGRSLAAASSKDSKSHKGNINTTGAGANTTNANTANAGANTIKNADRTPKIDNTASYADNSSMSSLPSQPLLQYGHRTAENHPPTTTLLRKRNAAKSKMIRSSSPLFGGTQKVQLEKLLSRGNNHSKNNNGGPASLSESASATITEGGGSSGLFDCGGGAMPMTSSISRRKVQWGHGGSGKLPVLITANEDSTEVVTKQRDNNSSSRLKGGNNNNRHHRSNVDMRLFATYHEEIVTALIDSALGGNNEGGIITQKRNESSLNTKTNNNPEQPSRNAKSTTSADDVKSSPKRRSLTPIKMKGRNSPHRTALSTPLWKKNRSSLKLPDSLGKAKNERRASIDTASASEKSLGMFQFKTKNSAASTILSSVPTSLEKKPLDYFHPNCRLMKEKGSDKRKAPSDGRAASAVGKDAVLEKLQVCRYIPISFFSNNIYQGTCFFINNALIYTLGLSQEKLSMLGDIESGKYGKAADMLQSDAVAFSIQGGTDQDNTDKPPRRGHVRNGSHGSSKGLSRSDSNTAQDPAIDTAASSEKRRAMVETRSLLTLRMGFVSMSYGILLQWDSEQRLVDLIVLRKMCRDDFLERTNEEVTDSSAAAAAKSKLSAESSTTATLESNESKVTGGLKLFPLLNEPDQRPKSFLSVSVVNVKNVHTGCESCLDSGCKEKRHLLRPYIRFALGKHGECIYQCNGI